MLSAHIHTEKLFPLWSLHQKFLHGQFVPVKLLH